MARLPSVGGDNGNWGQILNDFLSVEHNADGTLRKANDISVAQSAANAAQVDANNAQSTANSKYTKPSGGIPEADLDSVVQGKLNSAGTIADGSITSAKIADGTITNADINSSAAIAQSKIANLTTDLAGKASATHTHAAADITSGTVTAARLGSGAANSSTFLRGDNTWAAPPNSVSDLEYGIFPWKESGVVAENSPRNISGGASPTSMTNSGVLRIFPAIKLKAGLTYSGIRFVSQGTGIASPTMQWACILSYPGRVILAVSPDYTTTAWASSTAKDFIFNTPYTPVADELVLAGLCLTATTHPALVIVGGNTYLNGSASPQQTSGPSNSGLTSPMSVGQAANALGAATTGATHGVPYIALL